MAEITAFNFQGKHLRTQGVNRKSFVLRKHYLRSDHMNFGYIFFAFSLVVIRGHSWWLVVILGYSWSLVVSRVYF